ncbi:GLE1-like protein-domain-containing protein [Parachaetomium inaequale]|uniref:mRNA export factor GLE1 n=1 Tax=Parachaetomium inaequale TaxID=2588326 RepID=A0AAN6SRV0_9PEZI|nr:GLE1-like protein-domain-containing protein [Parachaetomium inaequale]
MAGSSPSRRPSYHWATGSPQRTVLEEILGDDRNSEARHRYLLETAKREHDRVREEAERVYREQLQKEERQRISDARRKEEERIRLEEELAADRARLNALKAKKVAIPPPLPEPEPAAAPTVNGKPPVPAAPSSTNNALAHTNGTTAQQATTIAAGPAPVVAVPKPPTTSIPAQPQIPAPATVLNKAPEPAKPASSALGINGLLNNTPQPNGATSTSGAARSAAPPPAQARPDRYAEIHKSLKMLRKFMADQAKTNPALKGRMGDMRREIRKSVGQLTVTQGVAGVNKIQQQNIFKLLREALSNQVQSQMMDPSNFVLEPRNPANGATHNDPALPSIFLYLVNIFAKAAISQFINEAGARPETADPVGVCVAATLSEPDFLWRGVSLMDILLAKFRIVCPVLFGYRGSEKTEQGRQRLGWWKDSGQWVPEQQHMDRMTGLGAGFASISLRNFAMSKKTNPFPPREYWTAMSRIVNTPSAEISNTQCVVLKAMVETYEQKFIEFYGTAALAALRTALIEFPARAPQKSAAVNSLEVLAQLLKRDTGLVLG